MLVIRLFRTGKKNQPSFKIVVTDKRKPPRAGRFVEQVGFYNPRTKEKILKQDRIKYWLSVGAKPSATLHNLLVSEKIIESQKIPVHKKSKEKKEGAEQQEQVQAGAAQTAKVPQGEPAKPVEEKPAEPSSAKAPDGEEKPAEEKPGT